MNTQSLRKKLFYYQRMMMDAKAASDHSAHEVYKQLTRDLSEQIQENEKSHLRLTDGS